jgi:hypothetical protein
MTDLEAIKNIPDLKEMREQGFSEEQLDWLYDRFGNLELYIGIDVPRELAAVREATIEEVLDYGTWMKDKCDLHEKYTSACCGCQKAKAVFMAMEQYQDYIKRELEQPKEEG